MSADDTDPELTHRHPENDAAYDERPSLRPPWYVSDDRCIGLLPGTAASALRLSRLEERQVRPTFDRGGLDRLANGFAPAFEATYSVRRLLVLLGAFLLATNADKARLSVGACSYLRFSDPETGTVGFLGPILLTGRSVTPPP